MFTPYSGERVHPGGHTWHHVEDGRTMKLVPSDLHGTVESNLHVIAPDLSSAS